MKKQNIVYLEKSLFEEINKFVSELSEYSEILKNRSFLAELLEVASISGRIIIKSEDNKLKNIYLKHLITLFVMNHIVLSTSGCLEILNPDYKLEENLSIFKHLKPQVKQIIDNPYFTPFKVNDSLEKIANTIGILSLKNADILWKDWDENKYYVDDISALFSLLPHEEETSINFIINFIELQVYLLYAISKYSRNSIQTTLNFVFGKVEKHDKRISFTDEENTNEYLEPNKIEVTTTTKNNYQSGYIQAIPQQTTENQDVDELEETVEEVSAFHDVQKYVEENGLVQVDFVGRAKIVEVKQPTILDMTKVEDIKTSSSVLILDSEDEVGSDDNVLDV